MINPDLVAWAFKYEDMKAHAEHLQRRLDFAQRELVRERRKLAKAKSNGKGGRVRTR